MKKPIILNINRYIGEKQDELLKLLEQEGRILLAANPGSGKTWFAAKLAKDQAAAAHRFIYATFLTAIPKQLKDDFSFDLICSSYEKVWTDRLSNFQDGDNILERDELVIGTTLHQLVRFANILTQDDVIVIDEAHQLVQLSHQNRINQLRDELNKTQAKLLLMTGTPYEEEDVRLKMTVVNVVEKTPRVDKLIYLPITESLKKRTNMLDLTAALIHWHLSQGDNAKNQKMLVYNNNSKIANTALAETIEQLAGYKFDNINADTKESEGYKFLMSDQKIRDEVQGIITTSAIKEGVNIKNQDVEKIIVLGQMTLKDEKQVAKRIRGDKPLEIYRIFNEPTQDDIDEVDFEIDLVNLLFRTYEANPERLKKTLQRLANCGEILKSTGILSEDVETINKVKTQHIMEYLDAAKCNLSDYISRQTYNDLEALDGNKYLEETYGIFLADSEGLGQFTDKIKFEKEKAQNEKDEELMNILLILFGDSEHFAQAINLLKGDLISYSTEGKLLQEMDVKTIKQISTEDYVNPIIKDDPFEDMDDKEIKELMIEAVKVFSSKFRDEMTAAIKILLFLMEFAEDYKDVLPVFNQAVEPLKLEWHADRFMLSKKLDWIRAQIKNRKTDGLLLRAALKEKDDRVRLKVMQKIESFVKDYSVVQMTMLTEYIRKTFGDVQYMQSLNLHLVEEIKLFVHAMGVVTELNSWKRSDINKKQFDKLWKDSGKTEKPKNRNSLRVLQLVVCGPAELIKNYKENI